MPTTTESHTLGEWELTQSGDHTIDVCVIRDEIRSVVARLHVELLADEHGGSILANARLLAAAPDLLAACEDMIGSFDAVGRDGIFPSEARRMRAAIAKAKGGP